MHAVGSGRQSSPLWAAVVQCFALVRCCRAAPVALFPLPVRTGTSLGKLHPASCGTLDPDGGARENGCIIQPLRPLTA
uniref:Uncharacterized protein n=1 Tax=Xanthomonas citri pv. mangiferaeindicae TaxID=454594 RepID=A0A088FNW9_XANCI|nr:hypothetical protein [Xanthomonas citri pv. mangiferaeindicae]